MKYEYVLEWLVLIGAVLWLLVVAGQSAVLNTSWIWIIQAAVGISGLYLIAKKLKLF